MKKIDRKTQDLSRIEKFDYRINSLIKSYEAQIARKSTCARAKLD